MPKLPPHRINALRDEVLQWAVANHEAELFEGMRCFTPHPQSESELRAALAFSILAPPPGESALVVRFAQQSGRRPRAERVLLSSWAQSSFGVLHVRDLSPGSWIEVHDVLSGRRMKIAERVGSEQLEAGDWIAAYTQRDGAQWVFEGTMQRIPTAAAVCAVAAAIKSFDAIEHGGDVQQASPAQTHQIARAALNASRQTPAAEPEEEGTRWSDRPHAALNGLSPQQAAGVPSLVPMVWALLIQRQWVDGRTLGLALPTLA